MSFLADHPEYELIPELSWQKPEQFSLAMRRKQGRATVGTLTVLSDLTTKRPIRVEVHGDIPKADVKEMVVALTEIIESFGIKVSSLDFYEFPKEDN